MLCHKESLKSEKRKRAGDKIQVKCEKKSDVSKRNQMLVKEKSSINLVSKGKKKKRKKEEKEKRKKAMAGKSEFLVLSYQGALITYHHTTLMYSFSKKIGKKKRKKEKKEKGKKSSASTGFYISPFFLSIITACDGFLP